MRLGGRSLGKIRRRRRRRGVLPRRAVATRSSSTTFCIATARACFPLPLGVRRRTARRSSRTAPDMQVDQHFIFRVFAAKRNTFLQTVAVERYFAVPKDWRPPPDSTVRVAAHLRNGAPLVVERSFGKGRVMAFLTTAAPTWNNWARNPSFVVAMQDLQAYLVAAAERHASRQVGSPLELRLGPGRSISRRSASPRRNGRGRRPRPPMPCSRPAGPIYRVARRHRR